MRASRRNFLAAGLGLPVLKGGTSASAPAFSYRVLGKTGVKVTSVGCGCMITSDPSVIEKAAEIGISYFDTARGYQGGNNEKMVGAALKARRKQVILSSKSPGRGPNPQSALQDLDTSLRELGTDYLDIWYLHGKDKPEAFTPELLEAQATAQKQGKIRFRGVSTHRVADVAPTIIKLGTFDVVLVTYNFTMDEKIEAAVKSLSDAGMGVVAMKVMAGGTRAKKPKPQMQRPGAGLAALRWVLKNPGISTTIPSMTDMDQLDENLAAMAAPFGDSDQKLLTARLEEIRPNYCRMCGACSGKCPEGLPVSDILRYLMYADSYGQFALGREHFMELPEEIARVRCGDCSGCPVHCPNGVHVTEHLIRAQELFA